MSVPSDKSSRREFLRGVARAAAAAGLAVGAGALVASGKARFSQECVNGGICRGCAAYEDCILPQALSARREGMKP